MNKEIKSIYVEKELSFSLPNDYKEFIDTEGFISHSNLLISGYEWGLKDNRSIIHLNNQSYVIKACTAVENIFKKNLNLKTRVKALGCLGNNIYFYLLEDRKEVLIIIQEKNTITYKSMSFNGLMDNLYRKNEGISLFGIVFIALFIFIIVKLLGGVVFQYDLLEKKFKKIKLDKNSKSFTDEKNSILSERNITADEIKDLKTIINVKFK